MGVSTSYSYQINLRNESLTRVPAMISSAREKIVQKDIFLTAERSERSWLLQCSDAKKKIKICTYSVLWVLDNDNTIQSNPTTNSSRRSGENTNSQFHRGGAKAILQVEF